MKTILTAGLLAIASTAFAADKVLLELPVTYTADASVVQPVREQCEIEDKLTRHVGAALATLNRSGSGTVASAAEAGDASVLNVQISHILGVGGGGWSGPKAVTIHATLTEKDGTQRKTRINRWSMGGFWGPFKGTCSIIERCTVAIGKDLQRWVRDASYAVKDEGPPKEGAPVDGEKAPGEPAASDDKASPSSTPPASAVAL
nr:hypothetical protein [uncultured Albidiferax sp.]